MKRADRLVTVFGGSGFLGRHVVRALAKEGWLVRVATRRPELAFHLQPSGGVGQITAVQANVRYPESIAAVLRHADAAINLVGILYPSGRQTFEAVHHQGAKAIASAVRNAGITHFVHVSAIGADLKSPSAYAKTKAEGEMAVREILPNATILRPSVVFGPEDDFFNRFATMARVSPALPLIGGGGTKLQPVYAGDVAKAIARAALNGGGQTGTTYELGGPDVRSLREIMGYILDVTDRRRALVSIPFGAAELIGGITEIAMKLSFGFFPKTFAITRDQVALLRHDNVVSAEAMAEKRTLAGFGISPESFEVLVPGYLMRYRKTGLFADQRSA